MRPFKRLKQRQKARAFKNLLNPARKKSPALTPLESRGDRPLQMTFDEQLSALVYFHLEEFASGRHLLQALEQNDFAKECVAPPKGIKKSAFFEAINTRGLEQLGQLFTALVADAAKILPMEFAHLGNLVSIAKRGHKKGTDLFFDLLGPPLPSQHNPFRQFRLNFIDEG